MSRERGVGRDGERWEREEAAGVVAGLVVFDWEGERVCGDW
jgi:hypothetical protein